MKQILYNLGLEWSVYILEPVPFWDVQNQSVFIIIIIIIITVDLF